MGRYSAGLTTGAGSTTLPICALVGGTNVRPAVREIGIFNTTATAVALKLVRLSTAGTPGSSATSAPLAPEDVATSLATLKGTYTSTGPTLADAGYRCDLGAAIGSGVIWTFPEPGFVIPTTASNGLGLVVTTGTGQACDVYFVWDE